jgi:hypothetical protein
MYDYSTPKGYGDSFFVYAFNPLDSGLTVGGNYSLQGIQVNDGDFICRGFSGPQLILGTNGSIQVYDYLTRSWFFLPVSPLLFTKSTTAPATGAGLFGVCPEKRYPINSNIRFDLTNVQSANNVVGGNAVAASQMAFYGVRRILNGRNDPGPSNYAYYEKPFTYPFQFALSTYGIPASGGPAAGLPEPTQYTIPIFDFDFELRRIEYFEQPAPGSGSSSLSITDENTNGVKLTNNVPATVTIAQNEVTLLNPITVTVIGDAITLTGPGVGFGATNQDIVNAINASPAAVALLTPAVINSAIAPSPFIPFEIYTIPGGGGTTGQIDSSPFKILLYDNNWVQRSNIPLLAELLCHTVLPNGNGLTNNNFYPSPGILYKVNSVIRFDIFSLLCPGESLPATISLLFHGVRRIRCQ